MKKRKLKKHIGLPILPMLLGLGLCLIVGTYAAYNNQAFQRGVVRNRDSEEIRFTSNLLKTHIASGDNDNNYETVLYSFAENTEEEASLIIPLKIANYLMGNDNLISEKDIIFDLNIRLTGYQEDISYTVNDKKIENGSITFSDVTLIGRKPNVADYEIKINGKDLNQLTITIEAKTNNLSRNKMLAAHVCPCTNSKVNPFSFSGTFLNSGSGDSPSNYYGYNYEVSISSGRAEVTLSWNPTYVKLDPFFLKKLESRSDSNLKIDETNLYIYDKMHGSVQFLMDQTLGEDDYVILFYPLQEKKGEMIQEIGDTWDGMKNMISVNAVEVKNGNEE